MANQISIVCGRPETRPLVVKEQTSTSTNCWKSSSMRDVPSVYPESFTSSNEGAGGVLEHILHSWLSIIPFSMHGSSSSPRLSLSRLRLPGSVVRVLYDVVPGARDDIDRKSTRLNSSHLVISYAVFCL